MLKEVRFDQAFTYAYSRREQTYAGLFYKDDVPESVKASRLTEVIDTFQAVALERNRRIEIGRLHVVLVEGLAKKSTPDQVLWTGRTDTNKRVVFMDSKVIGKFSREDAARCLDADEAQNILSESATYSIYKGAYVIVKIVSVKGHTLRGIPLALTSIREAADLRLHMM